MSHAINACARHKYLNVVWKLPFRVVLVVHVDNGC